MLAGRISELDQKAFPFSSEYALGGESDDALPLTYGPVSFAPTKNMYVFDIERISTSLDQLDSVPNYWESVNEYIEIIAVAAVRLKAYLVIEPSIELQLLHRAIDDPQTPEDVKRGLRSDSKLIELHLRIKQAIQNKEELTPAVLIGLDISILQHFALHCRTKHLGDEHLLSLICS